MVKGAIWTDFKRRPVAWIIGLGLLVAGIAAGLGFIMNLADYHQYQLALACDSPAFPSPDGCVSDLQAQVVSVDYNPGTNHAAPSGSITIKMVYRSHHLTLINGDDAVRFHSGDSVLARAWRSEIVEVRSTSGAWVDIGGPAVDNSFSGGISLACLGVGAAITGLLWLGALRRRSARR